MGGDAVVQLVGVGVDELRGIPCLLQLPDGGGQLGINPLVQGGEGVPLPEEGAGQAGEHLHLHVSSAVAVIVGQAPAVGAGLRQAVEVGQGVLFKGDSRQAGDVEETLRGDEDVSGVPSDAAVPGGEGTLPEGVRQLGGLGRCPRLG